MRAPQIVVVPVTGETRTEYVTRDVHEHRAPTDASVKLLREMEQAAEAKVIEAVRVGNTTFECVVHQAHDMLNDQVLFRAVFKLNGRQETAEYRCGVHKADDIGDAWRNLRDEIAKVIATRMIEGALVRMPKTFKGS